MKICPACGTRNFFSPGEELECKECATNLQESLIKSDNNHISSGCTVTLPKRLHDEYSWDTYNN